MTLSASRLRYCQGEASFSHCPLCHVPLQSATMRPLAPPAAPCLLMQRECRAEWQRMEAALAAALGRRAPSWLEARHMLHRLGQLQFAAKSARTRRSPTARLLPSPVVATPLSTPSWTLVHAHGCVHAAATRPLFLCTAVTAVMRIDVPATEAVHG